MEKLPAWLDLTCALLRVRHIPLSDSIFPSILVTITSHLSICSWKVLGPLGCAVVRMALLRSRALFLSW